ncbi:hypothetical protein BJ170DRAFT_285210 [Xylariales sp. AK1849]|nr:hypothetical protein BJ170DRAFT_285210 [Xylariales sp. AK1849]
MAVDGTPRSVADATRFTANTPHANTKARNASTPQSTTSSKAPMPSRTAAPRRPPPAAAIPSRGAPETLDERVRRLRAAHLAARNHDVSRMDRVINASRKYMDAAHRFTVMGLIGFSGLALLVTVYATGDMMIYNRKRRNEFFAVQKQLQADSLEAARLAYMSGTASEDQIVLVEEATARAKQAGVAMPGLLGAPQSAAPSGGYTLASGGERTVWPGEAMQESSLSGAAEIDVPKKTGLSAWLFGGLKQEDTAAGASDSDLSFSKEEVAASGRTNAALSALSEKKDGFKDQAKAAFEAERENQRRGGPLDQVGLGSGETKKGWLW